MNTNLKCCFGDRCNLKPLSIRLEPVTVDERARFVESVCWVLIDSRFGSRRMIAIIYNLNKEPKPRQSIISELTVEGPVPSYTILPDSEIARRYASDIIRGEMARIAAEAKTRSIKFGISRSDLLGASTETRGRGSPPAENYL